MTTMIKKDDSNDSITFSLTMMTIIIMIINIDNKKWEYDFSPIDEAVPNEISQGYSKAYVRHLIKAKEILGLTIASVHNLAFYLWLVRQAREKIIDGSFYSWKEEMVVRLKQRL